MQDRKQDNSDANQEIWDCAKWAGKTILGGGVGAGFGVLMGYFMAPGIATGSSSELPWGPHAAESHEVFVKYTAPILGTIFGVIGSVAACCWSIPKDDKKPEAHVEIPELSDIVIETKQHNSAAAVTATQPTDTLSAASASGINLFPARTNSPRDLQQRVEALQQKFEAAGWTRPSPLTI